MAAYMAGAGANGTEIAEALGTTSSGARHLLRRLGLRLEQRGPSDVVVKILISHSVFSAVCRFAARNNIEPEWFVARVLGVVSDDPEMMAEIFRRMKL